MQDLRAAVSRLADHRSPGDDDITDPEGRGDEAYAALVVQEVPALVQLATMLYGMPDGDVAVPRGRDDRGRTALPAGRAVRRWRSRAGSSRITGAAGRAMGIDDVRVTADSGRVCGR